jgi:predicted nucleic acid-binding protein
LILDAGGILALAAGDASARHTGAVALGPIVTTTADLDAGLSLFQQHPELGAFDAVLAAVAIAHGADALVSADGAFASVPELGWIDPATAAVDSLLDGSASGASASDR